MNTSEKLSGEVLAAQADQEHTSQVTQTSMEQTSFEGEDCQKAEPVARRVHRKPENKRGPLFVVRQILNFVFIFLGIVACIYYVNVDERAGIILFIIAMSFKMAECVIRFKK